MGKMNRIVKILPNGDKGRDCEVEKWCGEPAYQLSATDKPVSIVPDKGLQRYSRTIRYRCGNGHRFDKQFTITKNLLEAKVEA